MLDMPAMPSHDLPQTAVHEPAEQALAEHLELAHYITVFNTSAARVRNVIFTIVIFSVTMLVAQWNTTPASWITQRYDHLMKLRDEVKSLNELSAGHAIAARH